jgi:hypothetical protein
MDLKLIRIPPTILGVRVRLDQADEVGADEAELVAIVRASQQLLGVRNRLMGYALTVGAWPGSELAGHFETATAR